MHLYYITYKQTAAPHGKNKASLKAKTLIVKLFKSSRKHQSRAVMLIPNLNPRRTKSTTTTLGHTQFAFMFDDSHKKRLQ